MDNIYLVETEEGPSYITPSSEFIEEPIIFELCAPNDDPTAEEPSE